MKVDQKPKNSKTIAKTLSLGAFTFMSLVSLIVYFTEDRLSSFDYLLMLGAPLVLAALMYFVGRHHDPNACD